jgi:3-oxoacyl-[acyl-carrier-protein] synthase II
MNSSYQSLDGICITGMGICLPLAQGQRNVARALIEGQNAIGHVKSFDGSMLASDLVSEFAPSAKQFGLNAEELARFDRGTWFAASALEEAVAQATLGAAPYRPERIGIVVGTSHAGIQHIEKCFLHLRNADSGPIPMEWLAAAATEHTAAVLSERLGIRGPKSTISSACASSNTAVGLAFDWLVSDEVDCVIVVGTDTVSPSILAGFNALRAVSAEPSAPFSTPSGITLGEGAGVVVLERSAAAHSRRVSPLAWVRGYGLSGDAYHETATDTEGRGVEAAMNFALADAGITADRIDYVSAHGTGTDANDIPESLGTARVVGTGVPVSSPKSFLGHTLGASGVVELIVTLLFADAGLVPPTQHFKGPRPGCLPLNYVPNTPQAVDVRTFLCNNYGFGGNNSSLVISRDQGPAAWRQAGDEVALMGGGAVGAFGAGIEALFNALWTAPRLLPVDDEWKVPVARAGKVLAKLKLPCNARSSTTIKAAVYAVEQALTSAAAQPLVQQHPGRCALIGGVTHGALRSVEKFVGEIFDSGLQYGSATHFPLTTMNAAAGQASIAFGIKGFNTTFCGSVAALAYAHRIVRDGRQDRALTFGSDELTPLVMRALGDIGLLSPKAIAPFSGLPGINPGEGAGALLIERLTSARGRGAAIAAVLSGIGLAQDGLIDAIDPTGAGVTRAIRQALAAARLAPSDIGAIISPGVGPASLLCAEEAAMGAIFGSAVPERVSAAAATGMAPSALLPVHILLGAEVLRRREAPPAPGAGAARALPDIAHILVLHCSSSGEFGAVVMSAPGNF